MKKGFAIVLIGLLGMVLLAGCSQKEESPTATDYQYIAAGEVKDIVTTEDKTYILLDLRKTDDYNANHIKGSLSADLDAAISSNDKDTAMANLQTTLTDATGSANGSNDNSYILLCYSGNRYANTGTEYLRELGIDGSNIFILEGGYKGWTGAELEELLTK